MQLVKFGLISFIGLIFLAGFVSADITMINPIEKSFSSNDGLDLGRFMPGDVIELTFSNQTNYSNDFKWQYALVAEDSLPAGWTVENSPKFGPSLTVKVKTPVEASNGSYSFKVTLRNLDNQVRDEFFNAHVLIKDDLVKASFNQLEKEVTVDQAVLFDLTLVNDSLADHQVVVSSSLPNDWFNAQMINVRKQSVQNAVIEINPKVYGFKEFSFYVDSALNGQRLGTFNGKLTINPTLGNKYSSGLYGYSVFSPGLSFFYFFNAFISGLIGAN